MNKIILFIFLGLMTIIQANVIHYHYHYQNHQSSQAVCKHLGQHCKDAPGTPTYLQEANQSGDLSDDEASMVGDASWMFD